METTRDVYYITYEDCNRDDALEGCMWHYLGETIDHDYIYCMYMNEFK